MVKPSLTASIARVLDKLNGTTLEGMFERSDWNTVKHKWSDNKNENS